MRCSAPSSPGPASRWRAPWRSAGSCESDLEARRPTAVDCVRAKPGSSPDAKGGLHSTDRLAEERDIACAMLTLLKYYHRYLTDVARRGDGVAGRRFYLSIQLAPWVGPLVLGIGLSSFLDSHLHFDPARRQAFLFPFLVVSLVGAGYVAVVFMSVAFRETVRKAEAGEPSEDSPWGSRPTSRKKQFETRLLVIMVAAVLVVCAGLYLTYLWLLQHSSLR